VTVWRLTVLQLHIYPVHCTRDRGTTATGLRFGLLDAALSIRNRNTQQTDMSSRQR
jgi:hypothetical protein